MGGWVGGWVGMSFVSLSLFLLQPIYPPIGKSAGASYAIMKDGEIVTPSSSTHPPTHPPPSSQ